MKPDFYKCELLEVSRKKLVYTSMPSRHYHDAYEILYLVSGDIYYFIGDKTYQVVGGVLLFINENELHKLVNSSYSTFERITLIFKKEYLQQFFTSVQISDLLAFFESGYSALKMSGQDQHFIENLFQKMIREGEKKARGYEQYQQILLLELLLFLNRKVFDNEQEQIVDSNRTHKKIFDIVNYVNEHYMHKIKLTDISQHFDISPSYLSRTFKEVTGFTFIEYINNIRIKEARGLLNNSTYNVAEIADKVGFDNTSHFGRTFKIIMGVSPLSFRKRVKSEMVT
ncbi:AraC family transcriptional regulator [Paenibacillus pini]|uniref:Transcriptional regulator n=1 Tax=Paenibacillus pini JCM 16418 TaxID=1236976 RepID=W7YYE9_9BACL|nr:AraC family transcriptional regulator [Paenibacillus pini]GAF07469.1 transcriptional regulator [Paenibacillus pini JCM 16418]